MYFILPIKKMFSFFPLIEIERQHEISNNVVCATSQGSDQSLLVIKYSMTVKLLTEQHFEFIS